MTIFTNGKGVYVHTTIRGGHPLFLCALAPASVKLKKNAKSESTECERKKARIRAFPPLPDNTGSPVPEPRAARHRDKIRVKKHCAGSPVLTVLFCFSCFACPVRLPFASSVLPCPLLPVQFCLPGSACPVLPVLFCLSCSACFMVLVLSGCPLLSVLPCLSYPRLAVLSWKPCSRSRFWLSCARILVMADLFCCLFYACPVPAVLFFLSSPGCNALAFLPWQSCPGCPVFAVLF